MHPAAEKRSRVQRTDHSNWVRKDKTMRTELHCRQQRPASQQAGKYPSLQADNQVEPVFLAPSDTFECRASASPVREASFMSLVGGLMALTVKPLSVRS